MRFYSNFIDVSFAGAGQSPLLHDQVCSSAHRIRFHDRVFFLLERSSFPVLGGSIAVFMGCFTNGEIIAWITDSQVWISRATLTLLEIILGIDNIVVISILAQKLPMLETLNLPAGSRKHTEKARLLESHADYSDHG